FANHMLFWHKPDKTGIFRIASIIAQHKIIVLLKNMLLDFFAIDKIFSVFFGNRHVFIVSEDILIEQEVFSIQYYLHSLGRNDNRPEIIYRPRIPFIIREGLKSFPRF